MRARAARDLGPEEVEESVKLDGQRVGLPVPRYGPRGAVADSPGPLGKLRVGSDRRCVSRCRTLGGLLLDEHDHATIARTVPPAFGLVRSNGGKLHEIAMQLVEGSVIYNHAK